MPKKPKTIVAVHIQTHKRIATEVGVGVIMLTSLTVGAAIVLSLFGLVERSSTNLSYAASGPVSGQDNLAYVPNELLVKVAENADIQAAVDQVIAQPLTVYVNSRGVVVQKGSKSYEQALQPGAAKSGIQKKQVTVQLAKPAEQIFNRTEKHAVLDRWYRVVFAPAALDLVQLRDQFAQNTTTIEEAQLNTFFHADAAPNDEYFSLSGSWGQPYEDLWGLKRVDADDAWTRVYRSTGDANADGTIDEKDITFLQGYIFSGDHAPDPIEKGDVNGDGLVNVSDVVYLTAYLETGGPRPMDYPRERPVIAVIDSGVDTGHEDIAGNIWKNTAEIAGNHIDDDQNGYVDDAEGWNFVTCERLIGSTCYDAHPANENVDDLHGHGTHVAGIISAEYNNGKGIAGVCPQCVIMPLRGLNRFGGGMSQWLAEAVVYAADNGADIMNNSWGGTQPSPIVEDAFTYAAAQGVLAVASAGNANRDIAGVFPASYSTVMSVGATSIDDTKVNFSNYGKATQTSKGVDISAPGGDNTGKSWKTVILPSAFKSGYHSSSLPGAYAEKGYGAEVIAQQATLYAGTGPDHGIIDVYFWDEAQHAWSVITSIDTYAAVPSFSRFSITIPPAPNPFFLDGRLRFFISSKKNYRSSGNTIDIDGILFKLFNEERDDSSFAYYDSTQDIELSRNILSLRAFDTYMYPQDCCIIGTGYLHASGTSMSAPFVAGAAGLLLTQDPGRSASDIAGRLNSLADPIDSVNPGYVSMLGGRLNVLRAIHEDAHAVLKVTSVTPSATLSGKPVTLAVDIINTGTLAENIRGKLSCKGSYVTISDSDTTFDSIEWGERASNRNNALTLSLTSNIPDSTSSVSCSLILTAKDGSSAEHAFSLPLASVTEQIARPEQ